MLATLGALVGMLGGMAGAFAAPAWPQAGAIRIIVPFGPGSTPDTGARLLAEGLQTALGQTVIVENKPGAGGNIGTGAVARARPDGYTFGLTISGPLAANTLLTHRLGYDPAREIAPVALVAVQPNVLVVHPRFAATDARALLAVLRAAPGKYSYASTGVGSISHLAMAALSTRTQADLVHVPYASSNQAVTALIAGDVQVACLPAAAVMPQVRAGSLRALAVATPTRSALLPDLPTLAESGLPDIQADAWMALVAPTGTPAAVIARVNQEVNRLLKRGDVAERLRAQSMTPLGGTPEALAAAIAADLARWRPVIARDAITLD